MKELLLALVAIGASFAVAETHITTRNDGNTEPMFVGDGVNAKTGAVVFPHVLGGYTSQKVLSGNSKVPVDRHAASIFDLNVSLNLTGSLVIKTYYPTYYVLTLPSVGGKWIGPQGSGVREVVSTSTHYRIFAVGSLADTYLEVSKSSGAISAFVSGGLRTTVEYDTAGRVVRVIDPLENEMVLTYVGSYADTLRIGHVASYRFIRDELNNLIQIVRIIDSQVVFKVFYDNAITGLVSRIESHPTQEGTKWMYYTNGSPKESYESVAGFKAGASTKYFYTAGRVDVNGIEAAVTYLFSAKRPVRVVRGALTTDITYLAGSLDLPSEIKTTLAPAMIAPSTSKVSYVYNALGLPTEIRSGSNGIVVDRFNYNAQGNLTWAKLYGNVADTTVTYNASGYPVRTVSGPITTDLNYDTAWNVVQAVVNGSARGTATYDSYRRLKTFTDPTGGVTRTEYHDHMTIQNGLVGMVKSVTDSIGNVASFDMSAGEEVVSYMQYRPANANSISWAHSKAGYSSSESKDSSGMKETKNIVATATNTYWTEITEPGNGQRFEWRQKRPGSVSDSGKYSPLGQTCRDHDKRDGAGVQNKNEGEGVSDPSAHRIYGEK